MTTLPTNESGHPEPYAEDYRYRVRDNIKLTCSLLPDQASIEIVGIDRDGDMPVVMTTSSGEKTVWLPPQDQRALRDYLNQHVRD